MSLRGRCLSVAKVVYLSSTRAQINGMIYKLLPHTEIAANRPQTVPSPQYCALYHPTTVCKHTSVPIRANQHGASFIRTCAAKLACTAEPFRLASVNPFPTVLPKTPAHQSRPDRPPAAAPVRQDAQFYNVNAIMPSIIKPFFPRQTRPFSTFPPQRPPSVQFSA